VIGGVSAWATAGIAHGVSGSDGLFSSWGGAGGGEFAELVATKIAESMVGGAASLASGGDFWSGAVGALGATAMSGIMQNYRIEGAWATAVGTAGAAVIGGTASALSGGSFANGALSGAFVYLFNDMIVDELTSERQGRVLAFAREAGIPYAIADVDYDLRAFNPVFVAEGAAASVSPNLLKATALFENRGWASVAGSVNAGVALEAAKSSVSDLTATLRGKAGGSYGIAQLGPGARAVTGMSRTDCFDVCKSIRGMAQFYRKGLAIFRTRGIQSPSHGQLATWYNSGHIGPVSKKYGAPVARLAANPHLFTSRAW
jgi:hypothetical protein